MMQNPPARIRIATDADAAPLLAMMRLFHAGENARLDRERLRGSLAELVTDARLGRVLIAEAGAEPLGYAVVTFGFDLAVGGRDASLTELYVRPTARRRGLGALLLAEVERAALAAGARHLRLSVFPENEPAFTLYRSRGFQTPPRVPLSKALTTAATDAPR
ncbi:MAG: GNAT family N-acetyltransferase [Deltaproteobacteria bacterium]|jgi:ribosomal protein S18 acetylase RimI-like enzyme|nr:GNAT family N-acetyltransferase [Deltaproteobacteria bacterium]